MENLREKLLEETRRQLFENGYASLNIRSIAKSCHIATGTVYNYFPSKEILTANVVLADWQETVMKMRQSANACEGIEAGLSSVYGLLLDFYNLYRRLFSESLMTLVAAPFRERHAVLRTQISDIIGLVIGRFRATPDAFLCDFLTESLLTASREEWSFDKLSPVLLKLIN